MREVRPNRSYSNLLACIVVVTLWLVFAGAANAVPVTWSVSGFQTAGDGCPAPCSATLTGTFVYDADTNVYSDITLTVSEGPTFPYDQDAGGSSSGELYAEYSGSIAPYDTVLIYLIFDVALSNAGAPGGIDFSSEEDGRGTELNISRFFDGTVTTPSAIPLPAALPLLVSALAVLGFAARRRRLEIV